MLSTLKIKIPYHDGISFTSHGECWWVSASRSRSPGKMGHPVMEKAGHLRMMNVYHLLMEKIGHYSNGESRPPCKGQGR